MGSFAHEAPTTTSCDDLIREVESLRRTLEQQAEAGRSLLLALPAAQRRGGENLLHYLALRSHDLRSLQKRLTQLGLSSLSCAESNVMPSINTVLHNLYLLSGQPVPGELTSLLRLSDDQSESLLDQNARQLLGKAPEKRGTRIMVTMSSEAAEDYQLVHQLVSNGMDCLRINCCHGDETVWSRSIGHLRDAERATGRSCRVLMDLGGPKLRLGPMRSEPRVVKIRPRRNDRGRVTRSARIWLFADSGSVVMEAADANLPVDSVWLAQIHPGDKIRLRDARGSKRAWRVREVSADGCWLEAKKTAYVENGTVLRLCGNGSSDEMASVIRNLPPKECSIQVRTGDVLLVSCGEEPGQPAIHDSRGELLSPGKISLPVPEVLRDARRGEMLCFDDGRITGMIDKIDARQLQLRIRHTRRPVENLKRDRGVNLPDTHLGLPALGAKDLRDLEFVARNADMIGLSFANSPDDVRALHQHIHELGCDDVGVILKIETRRGFANLPAMLFEAMKFSSCGVMIARGDLGVEVGFERMTEVQEEILWLCEAAHVPVIWATQVLEGLAKQGHATRAEVTDAGISQSAECVMLNKGPHVVETVQMLDDILRRMQDHRDKKRPQLCKLSVASGFKPEIN